MISIITNKFKKIINKIGKQNFILLNILIITLIIMGLYQTYSLLTSSGGITYSSNTKTYKFIIGSEEENELLIAPNDSKYVEVTIKNSKDLTLLYSLYYNLENTSEDIIIGYLENSNEKPEGTIDNNSEKVVSLKIINNSTSDIKISLGVNSGTPSGGELKSSGTKITEKIENLDQSKVNEPYLDNTLIPIYYNEEDESWHKADESNTNPRYKWYNYSSEEKLWANAVLVTSNTRLNYLNSKIGTRINEADVVAYFVWIPRYKYHVWNISRQPTEEYEYNYPSYSNGIEIKFEKGIDTTGNVTCEYNYNLDNNENNLSDICKINNINVTKDTKSEDAWYTHPAFTLGDNELTGFWIGKYETTGSIDKPTILPDTISIRNTNVSTDYTIAKNFNQYELTNNVDIHMLKNIEWGAVAYLTHSTYGICNNFLCNEINMNNATGGYTGRSSGTKASSSTLSNYGNYTYNGYVIENGNKTDKKDITKIASTTGNVNGVYDMSGGAYEYVMANMISNNKRFNPNKSGNNWNNNKYLSNKYYDRYSYGETSNNLLSYNRAILGDATSEVTINTEGNISAWEARSNATGITSIYPNKEKSWLLRGGTNEKNAGLFNYNSDTGDKNNKYSFRIALS